MDDEVGDIFNLAIEPKRLIALSGERRLFGELDYSRSFE